MDIHSTLEHMFHDVSQYLRATLSLTLGVEREISLIVVVVFIFNLETIA